VAVILFTLAFLSVGIYGSLHIEVGFDPFDMLSSDSYLTEYIDVAQKEYPEIGYTGNIVIDKIEYTVRDFEGIDKE
jgi:hypothetical protein